MGFPKAVKDEIFVKSARHCCVCHRSPGLNLEVHHIVPKHKGGKDTLENAIALCFDCHADAGHYFAKHPKGSKLSPEELKKHRESWFEIVSKHNIERPENLNVSLVISNKDFNGIFKPSFVKEVISYVDRDQLRKTCELIGKDPMEFINELKDRESLNSNIFGSFYKDVNSYDDYIDRLNSDKYQFEDEHEANDCQPVLYKQSFPGLSSYPERNLSNCVIKFKLINTTNKVLRNYKLYFTFENVVTVDSVDKNNSFFDLNEYNYNVKFIEEFKAEFYPDNNILLQGDSVDIDSICFRTLSKTKNVLVKWELFAEGSFSNGEFDFKIEPQFEISEKTKYVKEENIKDPDSRIRPKYEFD